MLLEEGDETLEEHIDLTGRARRARRSCQRARGRLPRRRRSGRTLSLSARRAGDRTHTRRRGSVRTRHWSRSGAALLTKRSAQLVQCVSGQQCLRGDMTHFASFEKRRVSTKLIAYLKKQCMFAERSKCDKCTSLNLRVRVFTCNRYQSKNWESGRRVIRISIYTRTHTSRVIKCKRRKYNTYAGRIPDLESAALIWAAEGLEEEEAK